MLSISAENLPLLKFALLLILFVHFSLLGVLFGSTTAAIVLDGFGRMDRRRHWRSLAVELVAKFVPGRGAVLLLALTASLALVAAEFAYPPLSVAAAYRVAAVAPLFAGLLALAGYRRLLPREDIGPLLPCGIAAAGLLLGLLSTLLLLCGAGVLVAPEKWPLLAADPRLLLSWVGTARFAEFTCLSLAASGALIFVLGGLAAGSDAQTTARIIAQRRAGAAISLVFLLAWPPVMLLGLYNLPTIALSAAVYAVAAASLATAAVLAVKLLGILDRPGDGSGRSLVAFFLALCALWVLGDHLTRENALDRETLSGLDAIVIAAPPPAAAAEPAGAAETAGTADGKAVFERLCTTCHRFEEKLVGPPLQSVLPKYRGNIEGLKEFIRNPSKQDPAYPAMPKLQLSEAELAAVARYLLERAAP